MNSSVEEVSEFRDPEPSGVPKRLVRFASEGDVGGQMEASATTSAAALSSTGTADPTANDSIGEHEPQRPVTCQATPAGCHHGSRKARKRRE